MKSKKLESAVGSRIMESPPEQNPGPIVQEAGFRKLPDRLHTSQMPRTEVRLQKVPKPCPSPARNHVHKISLFSSITNTLYSSWLLRIDHVIFRVFLAIDEPLCVPESVGDETVAYLLCA